MKFEILGPLRVTRRDGRVCTPNANKLRMVLALLLTQPDRIITADRMVDQIWSGAPPRTAATALQVYVSKLRKLLGTGCDQLPTVTYQSAGYSLDIGDSEYDLATFHGFSRAGRDAERGQEWDAAAEHFANGLALWRGPALADVRCCPQLDAVANSLDAIRKSLHESYIAIELRRGRHLDLIGTLYALAAEHSTWEAVHGYLMITLHRMGQPVEALRVYTRIREALIDEFGIEPGADLRGLQQLVLARDPRLGGESALGLLDSWRVPGEDVPAAPATRLLGERAQQAGAATPSSVR